MNSFVYILASKKNGTLYIGVTSDIRKRIYEHKTGKGSDFTNKYVVNVLVYIEEFKDIECAIEREKQLKRWHREWKINLIEENNPEWTDLFETINS